MPLAALAKEIPRCQLKLRNANYFRKRPYTGSAAEGDLENPSDDLKVPES